MVNFYGFGHGAFNSFLGASFAAYAHNIKHRYRFAFLDGCNTAGLGIMLSCWGATPAEIQSAEPFEIDFYDNPNVQERIHPGAFLGWKAFAPAQYDMVVEKLDPTTGLACHWRHYESMCNWHAQLLAMWENQGWRLDDSIDYANLNATYVALSYPSWPGPTPGWVFEVTKPGPNGGERITFNPATCLKFAGYAGLKFSAYNSCFDWYQR